MEVSQPMDAITHAVIGGGKTIDFGISNNAEFFDILSRTLYTDQIIAGQHIERLEEVRITGHMGSGVVVTPLHKPTAPMPMVEAAPAEALTNPKQSKTEPPINPKDVAKTVAGLSRKEQAQKLFKKYQKNPSQKNKDKLVAFKKSVKLGWKALGIDESELQ